MIRPAPLLLFALLSSLPGCRCAWEWWDEDSCVVDVELTADGAREDINKGYPLVVDVVIADPDTARNLASVGADEWFRSEQSLHKERTLNFVLEAKATSFEPHHGKTNNDVRDLLDARPDEKLDHVIIVFADYDHLERTENRGRIQFPVADLEEAEWQALIEARSDNIYPKALSRRSRDRE